MSGLREMTGGASSIYKAALVGSNHSTQHLSLHRLDKPGLKLPFGNRDVRSPLALAVKT